MANLLPLAKNIVEQKCSRFGERTDVKKRQTDTLFQTVGKAVGQLGKCLFLIEKKPTRVEDRTTDLETVICTHTCL